MTIYVEQEVFDEDEEQDDDEEDVNFDEGKPLQV